MTVAVASVVVTTAALTGLVELRGEGSSAPNVRHRATTAISIHVYGTDVTPRRIERPLILFLITAVALVVINVAC